MPTTTTPTREEAELRECVDGLAQALRAKDIDALMAHYAPDKRHVRLQAATASPGRRRLSKKLRGMVRFSARAD
jgi:ketosteroid isomerase-like protein